VSQVWGILARVGRRTITRDGLSPSELFDVFVKRAEELRREPAVQEGHFNIELSLKFEAGGPLGATSREPNEALFRSFLLTFRKFVSDNESVYVDRVYNVLYQEIRSDRLRDQMADARREWRAACKVGGMRLVDNGRPMEPAHVMDLWLNGGYFHNDRRKEKALEQLDPLGTLFSRHVFLNHVIDATKYVFFLAQVIVVARRQGLLD